MSFKADITKISQRLKDILWPEFSAAHTVQTSNLDQQKLYNKTYYLLRLSCPKFLTKNL